MESKENTTAIQFEDQLNRFLKGEMASAEEQEFKEFLELHPEQKRKAITIARLTKAMQQVGESSDSAVIADFKAVTRPEVAKVAATACGKKSGSGVFKFRRIVVSLAAVASILLCVFGGYKYYTYEQVTSLGQEYLAYFQATKYSRGEEDNVSNKIETLYTNISNKKDLDTTIEELIRMWNESRSETYNDYTEYMPELGWMLANAYLRDNEKGKAIEVLDQLIKDCHEDTTMGEKSRELKQKIEKL